VKLSLPHRRGAPTGALARSVEDPDAFAEFYATYAERVLVFFTRRVLDAEVAMELTAETFAQALAKRRSYRGRTVEEEQGWLFSIARTQLTRLWRRGRVERSALERIGAATPVLTTAEVERVERLAGLHRLRPALRDALAGLPPAQRRAIELRVVGELDYAAVAAELDVSEDVARARVSRGLRAMAVALDGEGIGREDDW
jgi:RNA polymerase sigma factor (sigma-70 family)